MAKRDIKELTEKDRNVDIDSAKVIEVGEPRIVNTRFGTSRVADFIINDETGKINLALWNNDINKVSIGSLVTITNGYVNYNDYKQKLEINIARNGSIFAISKEEQERRKKEEEEKKSKQREELESEARRLGIDKPELLSLSDLRNYVEMSQEAEIEGEAIERLAEEREELESETRRLGIDKPELLSLFDLRNYVYDAKMKEEESKEKILIAEKNEKNREEFYKNKAKRLGLEIESKSLREIVAFVEKKEKEEKRKEWEELISEARRLGIDKPETLHPSDLEEKVIRAKLRELQKR